VQELTITEAARAMGISSATVKRRLKTGELNGRQVTRPQGFLWVVEVDQDHSTTPPTTGSRNGGSDGDSTGADLPTLVTMLQAQVAAQTEELDARRREVQELHVLLQTAQAALPPPPAAEPERRRGFWSWLWGGN